MSIYGNVVRHPQKGRLIVDVKACHPVHPFTAIECCVFMPDESNPVYVKNAKDCSLTKEAFGKLNYYGTIDLTDEEDVVYTQALANSKLVVRLTFFGENISNQLIDAILVFTPEIGNESDILLKVAQDSASGFKIDDLHGGTV